MRLDDYRARYMRLDECRARQSLVGPSVTKQIPTSIAYTYVTDVGISSAHSVQLNSV